MAAHQRIERIRPVRISPSPHGIHGGQHRVGIEKLRVPVTQNTQGSEQVRPEHSREPSRHGEPDEQANGPRGEPLN